jgi:hypothetical protein
VEFGVCCSHVHLKHALSMLQYNIKYLSCALYMVSRFNYSAKASTPCSVIEARVIVVQNDNTKRVIRYRRLWVSDEGESRFTLGVASIGLFFVVIGWVSNSMISYPKKNGRIVLTVFSHCATAPLVIMNTA